MFAAPSGLDWRLSVLWLAGIVLAAFAVAWLVTDRGGVKRMPYIGVLALATGGLASGWLVWSGVGGAFWTERWGWGIVAAVLSGAVLWALVHRVPLPVTTAPQMNARDLLWQAGVYGAVEGFLLSVLPVAVAWQAFSAAGWTDGWHALPAALAALAASAVLIAVHHLGYHGYRGRRLVMPVIACSLLSLVYLLTVSPIAAMGGHAILHVALLRRGIEMPPESSSRERRGKALRPAAAPTAPGPHRGAAAHP